MDTQEERVFHRPKFDPSGRLVARAELKFGLKVYLPSQDMPAASELGLSERDVRVLWEQNQIDTYPPRPTTATVKEMISKKKQRAKEIDAAGGSMDAFDPTKE